MAPTAVRPRITSGTVTSTHSGMDSEPTPYTLAFCDRIGMASRTPRTAPTTQPASAGTATCSTYEPVTWAGVKPIAFSTPILVVPAITAPLTTLATISTDIASAMMPKAMMNGAQIATLLCSEVRTSR